MIGRILPFKIGMLVSLLLLSVLAGGCEKMLRLEDDGLEHYSFVWREEVFPHDYRTVYRNIADGFEICPEAGIGQTQHMTMDGWADIEVFDRDLFGYPSETNLGIIRVKGLGPNESSVKVGVRAGHDDRGRYSDMWLGFADGVYLCGAAPTRRGGTPGPGPAKAGVEEGKPAPPMKEPGGQAPAPADGEKPISEQLLQPDPVPAGQDG